MRADHGVHEARRPPDRRGRKHPHMRGCERVVNRYRAAAKANA